MGGIGRSKCAKAPADGSQKWRATILLYDMIRVIKQQYKDGQKVLKLKTETLSRTPLWVLPHPSLGVPTPLSPELGC